MDQETRDKFLNFSKLEKAVLEILLQREKAEEIREIKTQALAQKCSISIRNMEKHS